MEVIKRINEAVKLVKLKDLHAAEKIYLELIENFPEDKRVYPFLGWLYVNMDRYADAVKAFNSVENILSDINSMKGLGFAYYALGFYKKAYPLLQKCVEFNPSFDVLNYFINSACENSKDVNFIWYAAQKMDELYPNSVTTWENYVLAALCSGHFQEAEDYCNSKLMINQESPQLYMSAGLVQEVLYSNFDLAKECYLQAEVLHPSLAVYYNLGLVCFRMKDFKNAERYLLKATEYDDAREINTSLYMLYAAQKRFEDAYTYFKKSVAPLLEEFHTPWNGERNKGGTLFVFADQGFGDVIMYSRYIYLLEGIFDKVILSVPPQLKTLMTRAFQNSFVEVVEYSDLVEYDKSTVLTLLPYLLGMDFYNIPFVDGYLPISDKKGLLNNKGLKVGFVWEAGGAKLRGLLDRTININYFKRLFELKGIAFYSLQLNAAMKACEMYPQLQDLSSYIDDFDATSVLISELDVIVTVDTSVAHLAAAMGKKTLIMIPYAADWRWFDDKKQTPWYGSAELFVQSNPLDWSDVVAGVTNRLEELRESLR